MAPNRTLMKFVLLPTIGLLVACSNGADTGRVPGTGGKSVPGSGGAVTSQGGVAGSGSAGSGDGGMVGSGGATSAGGSAGTATGGSTGQGGAAGNGGAGVGGSAAGVAGTPPSGSGGHGGGSGQTGNGGSTVPHVTPQNATSVPSSYGTAIANPGKVTDKTYSAYYYNANGSPEDLFKPPVKQSAPITKPVKIYTPPGYDPQKQYPYIIVMHGFDSSEIRWFDLANPKLVNLFDNLISSGITKPFIAVYPRGSQDTASANGYYSFGGEMMNDLIPFLEANYSLKKDRASRAMAGFSFGGMQSIAIGLCAHLQEFAWIAGFDAGGPGTPNADDIAKYLEAQNAKMYPPYYLYFSAGSNDSGAVSSLKALLTELITKTPYITSANSSVQTDIAGPGNGQHNYPTAEVGLYNFLRMAFSSEY
jgi:hypothetical protein